MIYMIYIIYKNCMVFMENDSICGLPLLEKLNVAISGI